jgi:putative ABC transport system permease protein
LISPQDTEKVTAGSSATASKRFDRSCTSRSGSYPTRSCRQLTVYGSETMEQIVNDSLAQKRLTRLLLASFAGLALVLAAVGIYGVMSQRVHQSTHEIGVRMALGAAPTAVLGMVLRNAMLMALAGIALGALAAIFATRLLASMLYGVGATDPVTFGAVAAVLAAVARRSGVGVAVRVVHL